MLTYQMPCVQGGPGTRPHTNPLVRSMQLLSSPHYGGPGEGVVLVLLRVLWSLMSSCFISEVLDCTLDPQRELKKKHTDRNKIAGSPACLQPQNHSATCLGQSRDTVTCRPLFGLVPPHACLVSERHPKCCAAIRIPSGAVSSLF